VRILAMFPRNFFVWQKPRWLDHLERNAVLDGDLVFLHGQVGATGVGCGGQGGWTWCCKVHTDLSCMVFGL
jgi:hypothetical protein